MSFFVFLIVLLCFFPLVRWVGDLVTRGIGMRTDIEHKRLDLIDRAVSDPTLDPQRRDELLRSLAHTAAPISATTTIGWISFCAGAALGAIGLTSELPVLLSVGIVVVAVGFALLSLPLVARELATREPLRAAGSVHDRVS